MITIILAGGKSSRMGQNKALMPIVGVRVIDRIIAEFRPVSEKVIVIANDAEPYQNLNVLLLEDAPSYKGQGPLAGIYTGLYTAEEGPCLVVACDMPFASAKLGCQLIDILEKNDRDAVIPTDPERIHPLFAAYNARIAEAAKAALEDGKRSVKSMLDRIDAEYVDVGEGIKDVWNMNTSQDYIKAAEMAKGCEENDV
ncbi:molybdenum cofactor guanylyltransferase [Siminovitchia sp. 179-K 8D1 HS]|uniref:molybdenum cofactor guanylyltransferase n=1 Tax=Siminovitchia sp. 179-K 8D1 HS TaxID=3142385 RepID=UPI0039A11BE0